MDFASLTRAAEDWTRWKGDYEKFSAMKCRLCPQRIPTPAGFEPETP